MLIGGKEPIDKSQNTKEETSISCIQLIIVF
jgi:hypothetical protein